MPNVIKIDRVPHPTDFAKNLDWRLETLDRCQRSLAMQRAVLGLCARDPVFFTNLCVCIEETRPIYSVESPVLPFILYPFQIDVMRIMHRNLGRRDMGMKKSRCQGASWLVLAKFLHSWLFRGRTNLMIASATEELADSTDDPNSMLPKVDFMVEHLPRWMQPCPGKPDDGRTRKKLFNTKNKSIIRAVASTGDIGRSGRPYAIAVDEFATFPVNQAEEVLAASQFATRCRIWISTLKPMGLTFNRIMNDEKLQIDKFLMHWARNPSQKTGLYGSIGERIVLVDVDFWRKKLGKLPRGEMISYRPMLPGIVQKIPELQNIQGWLCKESPGEYHHDGRDWPFVADGKLRSIWYDWECARTPSPTVIGQELDVDEQKAAGPFFDEAVIEKQLRESVMPPTGTYRLRMDLADEQDEKQTPLVPVDAGQIKVWCNLDERTGLPPPGRYILGADVSAGVGASDSAAVIYDEQTGEKMLEYVTNTRRPQSFADHCCKIGELFHKAKLIGYAQGAAGEPFVSRCVENDYPNLWFNREETRVSRKISDRAGFRGNIEIRGTVFEHYHGRMASGACVNRSRFSVEQCREFIHGPRGPEHKKSLSTEDPTASGKAHGDVVTADALANWGIKDIPKPKGPAKPKDPEFDKGKAVAANSFAARRYLKKQEQREQSGMGRGW